MPVQWTQPSGAGSGNPSLLPPGGTLPISDFNSQWYNHLYDYGEVTNYIIETSYSHSTGIIGVPYAAPDGTGQAIVKVSAASMRKIVRWMAQHIGKQPVLPHWITENGNDVLVSKTIVPINPQPDADMRNIWRVSGEYVYLLRTPQPAEQGLVTGWIPYGNPGQFIVEGSTFDPSILQNKIVPNAVGPTPAEKTVNEQRISFDLLNPIISPY